MKKQMIKNVTIQLNRTYKMNFIECIYIKICCNVYRRILSIFNYEYDLLVSIPVLIIDVERTVLIHYIYLTQKLVYLTVICHTVCVNSVFELCCKKYVTFDSNLSVSVAIWDWYFAMKHYV